MNQKYEILDPSGVVINLIEWDGVSDYSPGEGFALRVHVPQIPVDPRTDEQLRTEQLLALKYVCKQRIETHYPETTQRTMALRGDDCQEATACIDAHLTAYNTHKDGIAQSGRTVLLAYDVTLGWPTSWGANNETVDDINAAPADIGGDVHERANLDEGGLHGPDSMVYEGSALEGADAADVAIGAVSEPDDELVEEAAVGAADDESTVSDLVGGQGVLIVGDELATAKAIALMKIDDARYERIGFYDKAATQSRLDELRQFQMGAKEGAFAELTEKQFEELQALETFLPFNQCVDDYAQALRDAIRIADSVEAVQAIDIESNWPE